MAGVSGRRGSGGGAFWKDRINKGVQLDGYYTNILSMRSKLTVENM